MTCYGIRLPVKRPTRLASNECAWWAGAGGLILAGMDIELAALTGNALADPPRHLDESKLSRFAQILDQMPPVVVFELGDGFLLVDGYHRVEAARRRGRTFVRAHVRRDPVRTHCGSQWNSQPLNAG